MIQIFICLLLIVLIIVFPTATHEGVDHGFSLFMNTLFPYLLPVLLLANWLSYLFVNKGEHKLMLYGRTYLLSAIGGYPTGAVLVTDLFKQQRISKKEAELLLPILHYPNPLFIIGFISYDLLHTPSFGIRYLILLHSVAIFMLIIMLIKFPNKQGEIPQATMISPFITAIRKTIYPVSIVAITIIFFSAISAVIESFFSNLTNYNMNYIFLFVSSVLELTNGIYSANEMLSTNALLLFLVFYLTTQSLSIHLQVYVIAKEQQLSFKKYIGIRALISICVPILYILLF